MEEGLANGAPDRLVGPIRVLDAKSGGFELAGGMAQPLSGLQFLGRGHGPHDSPAR
jgi:hypothetical protein